MAPVRRRSFVLGSTAVLAIAVAGCESPNPLGPSTADKAKARDLVIGATAQPDTLDLTTNNAAAIPQVLLYNVYETLVKLDSDGQIRPLLATEWTVSADRLTYTFRLQPRAKFASGTPVTADAVVASIQHMKSSTASAVLQNQMAVVASATAVDTHTVQVALSHPSQFWLYNMTSTAGVVIDPAGMTTMATQPMGSGPFMLKSWAKGTSITLALNPGYWGTPARFDTVTFKYYADPNAENAAMLSGELDIISTVAAPQQLELFANREKYTVIEGTTNGEVVLGFNNSAPALKDKRVRQAITYAIDRQALRDSVWGGKGTMIGSMVPPTDPWYQDLYGAYPFDPTKAKELLKEAGYEKGLTLRLRVPSLPYATASTTFITSALKSVGITVTTDVVEFPGRWLQEVYTNADYDMTIVAHVEPRDIVNWADPKYYWRYNNPTFTALIQEADKADDATFLAKMKQAAQILSDDAAGDFLWLLPNLVVTTADITGVGTNATTLSFDLTTLASRNG